ncbi:MAG: hypothetical protein E7645_00720 [Ruminococcaceae bacterium]|nr:hypothetical protein [Oscillospiraceae bacterium]
MNVKQIFGKHYRRLKTEGVIKSAISGAGVCFAINAVFAFIYWMFRIGSIWLGVTVGLLTGALLGALLYLCKYRLTEKTVARRVDSYGLEERLITMIEFSGERSHMAELQRADAIARLEDVPAKGIKYKISAVLVIAVSVVFAVSFSLSTLGILAQAGKVSYGMDMLAQGTDGTFEVIYTVGEGGWIRGETQQSVSFGDATVAVRAFADDGWIFVGWDDGETSPERSETGVSSDMQIKAVFEKIENNDSDDDDSDAADDLPYGSVMEESGGSNSDELGGEEVKGDGEGGGAKWQDRNQFIDGATYYRDYLEFYYQYATGIFDSETDIPPEIIEFFETYFSGI